jgi:hypothetical protein
MKAKDGRCFECNRYAEWDVVPQGDDGLNLRFTCAKHLLACVKSVIDAVGDDECVVLIWKAKDL